MPPLTVVFDRAIEAIERLVAEYISNDQIENDPLAGPAIIDQAVKTVMGEPNTREALAILASIENIDDYVVDTHRMDEDCDMSFLIGRCLDCVIDQRLTALKNSVAVLSFAAGFPAAAERMVGLAEAAVENVPNSKWVSPAAVAEARAALERVLDRDGSLSDLGCVLQSKELLRGLLVSPKDKLGWSRHGLEFAEVENAARELKTYGTFLGLGQHLGTDALVALSNRADSQLRATTQVGKVSPPCP
jgi:hypothetical protein